ncbi:MAG TPA: hypothetical protein VLN91_07695 [Nitrospirota bacterium]|nr:hypothetical protein [Nitrospirota bacterium]
MKVADLIKQALEQKGLPVLRPKEAATALGISVELLRLILAKGHVPKDKTLGKIAGKLGMNASSLVLAAHQERVPVEMKGYFLSAAAEKPWRKKRVFPLSEEQCNYLQKIMSPGEIQLVRKLRQVPEEAQASVAVYVDYVYASKRTMAPAPADQGAASEHR